MAYHSDSAPHRRYNGRGREGVTLVETVMAILILAICVGGICKLIMMSRESSDTARDHYIAVNIAKNRLERARVMAPGQLLQLGENNVIVNEDGASNPNGLFRRTTIVSNVTPLLVEIVVTVQIRDRVSLTFDGPSETVRSMYADV